MLLRETGFTFNGLHSLHDFGLQYVEKDGHPYAPEAERNAYQIAGADGTVLFDGETLSPMSFTGSLYPLRERANQAAAQALLRRVAAWLGAGRKQLIFDYEPEVYYLAELDGGSRWSLKSWFGGEMSVKFLAQPCAYAVTPCTAEATVTAAAGTMDVTGEIPLTVDTGRPAPLCARIVNTGTATIMSLTLGSGAAFHSLSLEPDDVLEISFEPPAGAEVTWGDSPAVSALPKASRFQPVLLTAGDWAIGYSFVFSTTGTPGASITLSARGRW